nr:hypothetical protein StreXyl84_66580 [Streptomyces sp. Xyl84]
MQAITAVALAVRPRSCHHEPTTIFIRDPVSFRGEALSWMASRAPSAPDCRSLPREDVSAGLVR